MMHSGQRIIFFCFCSALHICCQLPASPSSSLSLCFVTAESEQKNRRSGVQLSFFVLAFFSSRWRCSSMTMLPPHLCCLFFSSPIECEKSMKRRPSSLTSLLFDYDRAEHNSQLVYKQEISGRKQKMKWKHRPFFPSSWQRSKMNENKKISPIIFGLRKKKKKKKKEK